MNSNGGATNQYGESQNYSDGQPNRGRPPYRRNRARGHQYDRYFPNRGRRNNVNRDYQPPQRAQPAVIDINDPMQFPSIDQTGPTRRNTVPDAVPQPQPRPQQPAEPQPREYRNYTRSANDGYDNSYGNHHYRTNNYRGRPQRYPNNPRQARGFNQFGRPNPRYPNYQMMPTAYYTEPLPAMQPPPPQFDLVPKSDIDCVQQVEYYFSEMNLISDQYLRDKMNEQGFVSLKLIHSFKRISFLKLSYEDFVERLRSSPVFEINEQEGLIRLKNDHEKWVQYNQYIRDRSLQATPAGEFVKYYLEFLQETYGTSATVNHNTYGNMPRPRMLNYFPPHYAPLHYNEAVFTPMPYYSYVNDLNVAYNGPNLQSYVGPFSYPDYNIDFGYDPNAYEPTMGSQQADPQETAVANPDQLSEMVEKVTIRDAEAEQSAATADQP